MSETAFEYDAAATWLRRAFPAEVPHIQLQFSRKNYKLGEPFWVALRFPHTSRQYELDSRIRFPYSSWVTFDIQDLEPTPHINPWEIILQALDTALPRLTVQDINLPNQQDLSQSLQRPIPVVEGGVKVERRVEDGTAILRRIAIPLTVCSLRFRATSEAVPLGSIFSPAVLLECFDQHKPRPYQWTPGNKWL